jgi:hypothetical protein
MKYPKFNLDEIKSFNTSLPQYQDKMYKVGKVIDLYEDPEIPDYIKAELVKKFNIGKDDSLVSRGDECIKLTIPAQGLNVNHERRMKKAYKEFGRKGYLIYYDKFLKPSQLKLQVWQEIAKETRMELTPDFIKFISTDGQ